MYTATNTLNSSSPRISYPRSRRQLGYQSRRSHVPDQQRFLNEDLVLRVSTSVDPARFNLTRYEAFIEALCGGREYQKEAIRTVLRYFLGGRYADLRQL